MARKIVGLVGKGVGPQLRVELAATKLRAEVRGLPAGDKIGVRILCLERRTEVVVHLEKNGETEIPVGAWVSFEYQGKGMPICAVKVS